MYIAIDGGGTKTEYLLLDETFTIVDRYLGQCVNHDFLPDSWEGTRNELQSGMNALLSQRNMKISEIQDVTAGLSGIDTRTDQRHIEECMKKMGVQRFAVSNDGFLAVLAECEGGWGIAYNCGTGVCCAAINEKGHRMCTAGLDDWSGDAGGGNWIVLHIFRQIYKDLFFWKEKTDLTEKYMREFQLETGEDVIDSVSRLKQPMEYPEMQRKVIQMLFEQFENRDEEAVLIINEMLHCAYNNVRAVVTDLKFEHKEIPLILTGSIHTKAANGEYLQRLYGMLQKAADHRLAIRMAEKPPVYGAIQWLKERND